MRPLVRAAGLALVLGAALSTSACVTPSEPDPEPSPTTTPLFASDEEALAAAEKAYRAYQAVSDQIFHEGGAEPERILTVASSAVFDVQIEGYEAFAANGWRSVGDTDLSHFSLESYDSAGADEDLVVAYGCTDLQNVDVVDAAGISVVPSDRPDLSPFEATFELRDETETLILSGETVWTGENFCG